MQNLEFKAQCKNKQDFALLKKHVLSIAPAYQTTLTQKDTYFHTKTNKLKIREWGNTDGENKVELIGYERANRKTSRMSNYFIAELTNPQEITNVLTHTLGIQTIVSKKRELYIYGSTRIHLDEVQSLGYFVELETVFPSKPTKTIIQQLHKEHTSLIKMLDLKTMTPITHSYSQLLK